MKRFFASALCIMAILMLLTACGAETAPSGSLSISSTEPSSNAPETPPAAGDLRLCDPLKSGGASTSNGFYFTQIRPDGNLNIKYLDYQTHAEIFLCNKPNCAHDDDFCGSFIPSKGLVPSLAVLGDKLLVICGGINVSNPSRDDLPHIDMMELNGENRSRVYQANAASEFGALITDDKFFYTLETSLRGTEDAPVVTQQLIQIDLQSGGKTVLADLGQDTVYLCDTAGRTLYYYSIAPKEGAASFSEIVMEYCRYNLDKNQFEKITENEPGTQKAMTIANEMLFTIDAVSQQITIQGLAPESGPAVTNTLAIDEPLSGLSIRKPVDGKILLDALVPGADGAAQSVTYVIDQNLGTLQKWPLFYQHDAVTNPVQVEIAAELPDAFLVKCGLDIVSVDYAGEGAYTMTNPKYATIPKQDFWNGIENYTFFENGLS